VVLEKKFMNKIYHLSSCSTNQRILKELGKGIAQFEMQDIKEQAITAKQLDEMKKLAGSYEALFSRKALKFRGWGLHEMELTEADYKKYILEEYTFLKSTVIINGKEIFVGNAPKTVEAAKASLK